MFGIASFSTWRIAAVAAAAAALVSFFVLLLHNGLERRTSFVEFTERGRKLQAKVGAFGFLISGDVWRCFAFFLCWTLAFSALQNFAPTVLRNIYSISLSWATLAVTAYMLGSAAGTVTGGFLATSASPDRAVAWGLSFAALIALLLATGTPPPTTVIPLMTAMGFAAGLAGPSRDMLVRKAAVSGAGAASYGRIYGFVYSGLDAGLALSPLLFGQLMDSSRFPQVMLGVAVFQGLAIFTALHVGARAPAVMRQS
jgi:predicted MFS family arabinose efflux permease